MGAKRSDRGLRDEQTGDSTPDTMGSSRRWRPSPRQVEVLTWVNLTGTPGPTTENMRVDLTVRSLTSRDLIKPIESETAGNRVLYEISSRRARSTSRGDAGRPLHRPRPHCGSDGRIPAHGRRLRQDQEQCGRIRRGCVKQVSDDGERAVVCQLVDTISHKGICIHRTLLRRIRTHTGPCDCDDPSDPCR